MKIVISTSSFAETDNEPMDILTEQGIQVEKNPYHRKMTESEIIEHLKGADGLLAGLEPLNDNVFQKCPDLKVIVRVGIGMENVDVDAAKKHGIQVYNTPDAPTEAVAEMTIAMMLAIGRKIIPANENVHKGIWKKETGFSLKGLNVLLIGYGRIGESVQKLLDAFGSNVQIFDPYKKDISLKTLEEGLKGADLISLHASGNEELLGEKEFPLMKEGVIIINNARGALVNEKCLFEALNDGKVANYAGDVFWEEPYHGMIAGCYNAILTPHISTYTEICRKDMEKSAVEIMLNALRI